MTGAAASDCSSGAAETSWSKENFFLQHRWLMKEAGLFVPSGSMGNLTCVLGRTAAYKGEPVTWDEMIKAGEKLEPDLKGLKS